jgi:RNA polymerase sigma-70 factor (ECF subfamily)
VEDSVFIRASQAGDRQALGELVERYYKRVYRLAYHYAGNHQDADDICQETFLAVTRSIGRLRDGQRFDGWIFVIASNLLRRRCRRRKFRLHFHAGVEDAAEPLNTRTPGSDMVRREQAAAVRLELQKMPEKMRLAAILVLMEGQCQKEAAHILGCSEASVSRYVEAARCRLKAGLRGLVD